MLTIGNGTSSNFIVIPVNNDIIYQKPPQDVIVKLAYDTVTQYTLVPEQPQISIALQDDGDAGTVGFDRSSYSVNESTSTVTVTIVRQGINSGTAFVTMSTEDSAHGLAEAGKDYNPQSRTISLPEANPRSNYTTTTEVIVILDDPLMEAPDEYFQVKLTNLQAGLQAGQVVANVTILEDGNDVGLQFLSEQFYVDEAAGYATITLTRKAKYPASHFRNW